MRPNKSAIALGLVAAAAAWPALAHPGHGGGDLAAGFAHPFSGLDHMLAMAAVGLWASLKGGKALWAWPGAFLAAMLAGYALGTWGLVLPWTEPAIMASIIVLGVLVAADARTPFPAGLALIGLFGLAHGWAHGAEAPAGGAQIAFPLGFALATTILHLTGLGAGLGLKALRRPGLVRLLGLGTALGGVALAVAS